MVGAWGAFCLMNEAVLGRNNSQRALRNVAQTVMINVAYGMSSSQIDNMGHLGVRAFGMPRTYVRLLRACFHSCAIGDSSISMCALVLCALNVSTLIPTAVPCRVLRASITFVSVQQGFLGGAAMTFIIGPRLRRYAAAYCTTNLYVNV